MKKDENRESAPSFKEMEMMFYRIVRPWQLLSLINLVNGEKVHSVFCMFVLQIFNDWLIINHKCGQLLESLMSVQVLKMLQQSLGTKAVTFSKSQVQTNSNKLVICSV